MLNEASHVNVLPLPLLVAVRLIVVCVQVSTVLFGFELIATVGKLPSETTVTLCVAVQPFVGSVAVTV